MFSRKFLTVSYRISAQSTVTIQKITYHRSLHLACGNLRGNLVLCTRQNRQCSVPVINATLIRHISELSAKTENASATTVNTSTEGTTTTIVTEAQSDPEELLSQIPEPPTPLPDIIETVVKTASEPTLQDIGLGSWYPPGLIQRYLDFLHTTLDLPWWAAIVITTLCVRTLMLPLVVIVQRKLALMQNVQPQMQFLQTQLTDARKMGDHMEVARITAEYYQFQKDKGINPLISASLPLVQGPIFLSFYKALSGMVNAPVESMKEGGILWFTDLTVPDPYYLLPLITSATMAATIELGTDSIKAQSLGNIRYFLRAAPIIMFPIIIKFEGAILCYWVSTNMFSLIQTSIFRIPKVRTYLNIPAIINHDTNKLPMTKKNFMEGFKESWTNMKVTREMNSRIMYDETVFEKAGRGPVPKTYKYNPLKRQALTSPVLSKKKD